MTETWKPIPGFDSFIVASSDGRVGILCSGDEVKVRKTYIERGYETVTLPLQHPNKRRFFVHRLVMLAFAGAIPEGMQVNHKNGVKNDNRISNLEYCTREENMEHARVVLGSFERAQANMKKLTEGDVRLIRAKYEAGGISMKKLARQFNVVEQTVSNIVRRKTWKHVE